MTEYRFRVYQDRLKVAEGRFSDVQPAFDAGRYYLAQYAKDGAAKMEVQKREAGRGNWSLIAREQVL